MSNLSFFIVKTFISGLLIAAISSLAKAYPKGAALLTALPMMTFLSLIWIYWENKDLNLLATYTKDVFLWVIPSLLFFIVAFYLFRARVNFFLSMAFATAALGVGVWLFQKVGVLK